MVALAKAGFQSGKESLQVCTHIISCLLKFSSFWGHLLSDFAICTGAPSGYLIGSDPKVV